MDDRAPWTAPEPKGKVRKEDDVTDGLMSDREHANHEDGLAA
jgi:hypothetical protein